MWSLGLLHVDACACVQHFVKARLDAKHNHWKRVFDFSKDDTALPAPHWSLMGTCVFGLGWVGCGGGQGRVCLDACVRVCLV